MVISAFRLRQGFVGTGSLKLVYEQGGGGLFHVEHCKIKGQKSKLWFRHLTEAALWQGGIVGLLGTRYSFMWYCYIILSDVGLFFAVLSGRGVINDQ